MTVPAKYIVSGGLDNAVDIWEAASGQNVRPCEVMTVVSAQPCSVPMAAGSYHPVTTNSLESGILPSSREKCCSYRCLQHVSTLGPFV